MSRCVECGAHIDPGLECPWRHDDEPTCSTCCGHDDQNPAPIPGQVDIFGQETP